MKIENPVAFQFIMQDEIYLLNNEKPLFVHNEKPETITEAPAPVFNYLGGNKKNFLIIVNYPQRDFMDERHFKALENTIKRLGFTIDDTAILNSAGYPDTPFIYLTDYFKPVKVLILGKNAVPAQVESLAYNKLIQNKNCSLLYTYSFGEMMDNVEYKKIFWELMKQLS
jgi:hypothetical protein